MNPETSPTNPLAGHPLDHPGVRKLALGSEDSAILAGLGKHILIIATPADATSPPEARGRFVLHCYPVTAERADDLWRLAAGQKPKARIKASKPHAQL